MPMETRPQQPVASGRTPPLRVAYVMSRFPKLTETFVLYEILALDAMGVPVEVYPLLRERQAVVHAEARRWAQRARFHPFLSLPILRAHLHYLRRRPRAYLGVLAEVLRRTAASRNFLVGALGIFPKTVRFAWEMQAAGVTHVHAHFATHPALAALVIHRLTGIPFSFTAHGSDLHVDRTMLDRKVEAAAFVVAVSRFNREVIVRHCGEAVRPKVHVVHCGVDLRVFPAVERRAHAGPLSVLCVASFEEVKGHRHLIEACGLLRRRGVPFECHLVGDGPRRAAVESQIEASGLRSQVHLHGPQARDAVVRLLAESDVLALPSVPTRQGKREGIPVVLMEAMASQLPVVSSRLSGIPELIESENNGLLVEPGDASGHADALQRLAASPELRARLGRAGRDTVRRDFDLDRNARALVELIRGAGRIERAA
jgi:glycosyltransferase involved in cell wall biosynthesis